MDKPLKNAAQKLDAVKRGAVGATPALAAASTAMGALGAVSSIAATGLAAAGAALAAFGGAAIAAGSALLAGGISQLDALDSLGDAAKKIGIGADALAGLEHAAKLSGVESEALEASLVKMNRSLSQAAIGAGPAAGALADLGLDAMALKAAAPEEAFQRIAEKINEIPNAADRAAVSMDIFGKAGANLLPMISEAGELGAKIKEASELGLAASQAEIEQVGAANDAIDTMKAAFKGLFRTVAVSIAPFVQDFADGITNVLKYLNSFRESIRRIFLSLKFVLDNFREYWGLAFEYAFYKVTSWYNDVENVFTNVLPTVFMEGVKLVFPAWDSLTDYIAYSMVRITNIITNAATAFGNVLYKAVTFDFEGIGTAVNDAFEQIRNRQEGDIERMLRQDSERSGRRLDKLMGDAAKRIGEAFNRAEGPIEAAMRQSVEAKSRVLGARMDEFVNEKMGAAGVKKKTATEEEFERSGKERDKTENKAVERGSQEALKIVAGNKEDKALKKMDEQLKAANKANDLLAAMLRKPGLAKANI